MSENYHQPVLLQEVLEGLKVKKGGRYIDATVGDGGHAKAILEKGGWVLGLDRDERAIERTRERLRKEIDMGKLVLVRSNFDKLGEVVNQGEDSVNSGENSGMIFSGDARRRNKSSDIGILKTNSLKVRPIREYGGNSDLGGTGSLFPGKNIPSSSLPGTSEMPSSGRWKKGLRGAKFADDCLFDGVLFDLGMSSWQLEKSGRGFSFQKGEPLDMRMDKELAVTAADLVNGLGKRELLGLFVKLGQLERARAVVEEIVAARRERPIKTTAELAGVVEKVLPRKGRLHPATKVFMALRMAVNDELGSLERALPQAAGLLKPGGRLAVVSFQEGEDRVVKRFFRLSLASLDSVSSIRSARNPRSHRRRLPVGRKPDVSLGSSSMISETPSSARRWPFALIEVNKKPITATAEETEGNPRARSAKLRIGEIRGIGEIGDI